MKFHKLSFSAALLLTLAMVIVAIIYEYFHKNSDENTLYYFIASSLSVLVINYFVLESLFNSYGKKQIKKISEILPEESSKEEHNVNFKELEQRIQKNVTQIDMMKEMENYRKEYIGNVSHELKTPLFSIQGYVETLRDGAVENLNIRDKYLERIGSSVERLLNIVNDLDQISKYEAGEISLRYSSFDINLLIKEIFDFLEIDAQNKSAKLSLYTNVNQIFVNADKQKISQVLTNLISNAIHYSNREKALIKVNTKIVDRKVIIEVEDNGMGIKPEILPRIFERFYRVESSRSRKDGGSGLGLAIVKHILNAHHENITVESEYLEGTKFTFSLQINAKSLEM